MWRLQRIMDVVCMKHAIPFDKEQDCPICINEMLLEIQDDMYDGVKRKEWELKHNKVLGR